MTGMSPRPIVPQLMLRLAAAFLILTALASVSKAGAAAETAAAADQTIHDFQRLSDGKGWILLGQQLYWTDDNGLAWHDVTPVPASTILDVLFLDEQHGRAVLHQNDPSQFVLAATSDSGATWNLTPYDFAELANMPSGVTDVHMGWRDASEGWLVFELATGSNFSVGLLYTTQDGGITWQAHEIPLGEPAHFIDAQTGWVAGGPAGRLYRTQNGGQTWSEQSPVADAYYQLPSFSNALQGTLPAVILEDEAVSVEFFQTGDAGQTWTSAGRVRLEADTPFDASLPLSAGEAGDLTLIVPNSDRVVKVLNGELTNLQNGDGQSANIVQLDMAFGQVGWGKWVVGTCEGSGKSADALNCTRETKLLSTTDAGAHWEAVPLPSGQTSISESFTTAAKDADEALRALAVNDPDTQPYVGQGFDKCEVPSVTQMQKWWTSSPYNAVNLYIGGSARACANAALSDSFLAQLSAQGWRFIPTWVGPQANCAGYASKMSSDPEVAYNQGLLQANLASDIAGDLELAGANGSGTVIYYDLEAYNTSNITCRNAANAFISGWVAQMRERGNLGGVYGASCSSAVSDWASIENVPDALWIANWYDSAGAVSYRRNASVWGAACLSDSLWDDHQRIRQYAGGHDETWGGLTLNIDSNVIDGPVTVQDGTAGGSVPSQPLNLGPAHDSILNRNSDTWLSWKTNGDTCSIHVWSNSLDITANGNCSLYRLGVRPGGSYSWQVTSTNSAGNTIGPVWQFKVRPHGPSGLAVQSISATSVNLTWQLSADDPANIDGYKIYKAGVSIANVGKSVASYQVTGLDCNTAHTFQVTSVRQGVESTVSNAVDATTTTCAPSLVSPADGFVLVNRRPAFEWQPVTVATGYQIQISAYVNFSSLAVKANVSGTTYLTTSDLAVNTLYYWRVRGVGPFGNGDWSVVRTFRTANPPSRPRLSAPANGSLITNYRPKLNWTDSSIPTSTQLDHYQVQVAADDKFTSLLYDQSTTASEFAIPADLTPNSRYYWRVRAVNTLGHFTSWTSAWSFRTAIQPPILATPVDGAAFEHRRPAFDWSDVGGATKYTLQISRKADFSTLLVTKSPAASQYVMTTDLPRNTTLYWRVRTEGVNGPSRWTLAWSFHTGNPPDTPVLLAPSNNVLLTNYQPKLDWGNSKAPAGTALDHYLIQIAIDSGFGTLVTEANILPSQFVPSAPLAANTKYYWRVRAFNTDGHYSSWSSTRNFRTAISTPTLNEPDNASSPAGLQPAFHWQSVAGATSYKIQISRSSNFSSYLFNANVATPTYTPGTPLPAGATLYWRVRALGPNGPSLWSEVYQLNTP